MKPMRPPVLLLIATLTLGACHLPQTGGGSAAGAKAEPSDAELRQRYGNEVASEVADIRDKHRAALAAPSSLNAADAYADALIAGLRKNYANIGQIDWRTYIQDAITLLESATRAAGSDNEQAANALAKRAILQSALGDAAGANASIKAGFDKGHTYLTCLGMIGVYRSEKKATEAKQLCEQTRTLAKTDDDIYQLMSECLKLNQGEAPKQTVPWASHADWELYEARSKEIQARNLARRQAEEQSDALAAERAASPTAAAPSHDEPHASGPEHVSFTLRNSCRQTVKLFYGQTPKFGSGRSSTISGNSQQSESMREGDMIWIVDASDNGVSSYSVSPHAHEVEISESCTGFRAR
jgi:hypothetical protein